MISNSVQAKYLINTVRVEVEKSELHINFGLSGGVVRVYAKDQSVSFMSEHNNSVVAKLDDIVLVDYTVMIMYNQMLNWRLSQLEKVIMILDMGMDAAEASWPVEKLGTQPLGDHLSLWRALMSQCFPASIMMSFMHDVLEACVRLVRTLSVISN